MEAALLSLFGVALLALIGLVERRVARVEDKIDRLAEIVARIDGQLTVVLNRPGPSH